MEKFIRIFIALIVIVGLTAFARNNRAWAASSVADTQPSIQERPEESPSLHSDEDCRKQKDKHEKHKDKCKDDDDDDGTVQPPPDHVEICERGQVSVGGVATLEVKKLRRGRCVDARTQEFDPDEDKLPRNAGAPLSDIVVLNSPGHGTNIKICFAAPPGQKVKIYGSSWGYFRPVGTAVKNGLACTTVPNSGSYVLVGK